MHPEQGITLRYIGVLQAMEQKAEQMKDEVNGLWWDEYDQKKHVFQKLKTNACYWAPEIIRNKFWKELYKICTVHFNNASNPIHRELCEIYQKRINAEKTK
jgi:hypothetical protein